MINAVLTLLFQTSEVKDVYDLGITILQAKDTRANEIDMGICD